MPSRVVTMRQPGFSLIDLMVGVAVGMICVLVVFQTLAVSEGFRRTTVSGSDMQTSGAIALFTLQRDIRMAGYGFGGAPASLLGCRLPLQARSADGATWPVLLAPVEIVQGAAGAPDQLRVVHGDAPNVSTPTNLVFADAVANTATPRAAAGWRPRDFVVTGPGAGGCQMQRVRDIAMADFLRALPDVALDPPLGSGSAGALAANAIAVNLGGAPRAVTYSVWRDRLFANEATTGATSEIAEGVVDMQAQYGIDVAGTGAVDRWIEPGAIADWTRVRAVRFAILARSPQFERTKVRLDVPAWAGGAFVMRNLDGTDGATDPGGADGNERNWRNYRYRVYETVVPMVNVLWGAFS